MQFAVNTTNENEMKLKKWIDGFENFGCSFFYSTTKLGKDFFLIALWRFARTYN